MTQFFIGSQSAIDFLNTYYRDGVETLESGRDLLNWLVGAGLIDEAEGARVMRRVGAKGLDDAATEARRVREWLREWLTRWRRAPGADYSDELATLNKLMARDAPRAEVVAADEGLQVVERWHIASVDSILALIAAQIAALITEEQSDLVKTCTGPDCTLWFIDRTKAHRRVFCSPTTCGNRAKVAAFRQRQRE
ncbi:MAG: CGNR zinc finger domain-containing protein [Steroidobacter sp.]